MFNINVAHNHAYAFITLSVQWMSWHIFNRCNNVLYLRGVPEDEEIEEAEQLQDWDVDFGAVVLLMDGLKRKY